VAESYLFIFFIVEAAGGLALPCIVDVRDEQQVISAVESAVKTFGGMLPVSLPQIVSLLNMHKALTHC